MQKLIKEHIYLLPPILLFSYFCYTLNFTQDDAYISYRFVQNFLNGDGLVFNIGERVEGFTNFGWVLYMIFWGKLSLNYILISKLTGYLFGIGILFLIYLFSNKIIELKQENKFLLIAVYLTAASQSMAYWAVAGLETSAFAFFALLSLYLYLQKNKLLPFALIAAVLLRPEGAFIAIILVIIELITTRKLPKYSFRSALIALCLGLPYIAFKLYYYGDILPNSFYAKTGFSIAQLSNGLEYTFRFMAHYGFYGIPLLFSLFNFKKLSKEFQSIIIFTFIYTIYITLVGGDVLKVHRFFIPLIGLYALIVSYMIISISTKFKNKLKHPILLASTILLCGLTFYLPNKFVHDYNRLEKHFTDKMSFMAQSIKNQDDSNFSVALPTIGIFSYELIGHHIIDMLGLTDSTIARHAEAPIEGMVTTWKESKHNSAYILESAPDYIMFSTGVKPSAPAEKALMLYPRFLQSYSQIGWYRQPDYAKKGTVQMVFKKNEDSKGEIKPTYPLAFVDNYKLGMEAYSSGKQKQAISYFDKAIKVSKKPIYNYLLYQKAFSHKLLNEHEKAIKLLDYVLTLDSSIFMAHKEMYLYELFMNNRQKANIHKKFLLEIVPWYFPRIDSMAQNSLQKMQKKRR